MLVVFGVDNCESTASLWLGTDSGVCGVSNWSVVDCVRSRLVGCSCPKVVGWSGVCSDGHRMVDGDVRAVVSTIIVGGTCVARSGRAAIPESAGRVAANWVARRPNAERFGFGSSVECQLPAAGCELSLVPVGESWLRRGGWWMDAAGWASGPRNAVEVGVRPVVDDGTGRVDNVVGLAVDDSTGGVDGVVGLVVGDGTGRVDDVIGSVVDDGTGRVDDVIGSVVDDGTEGVDEVVGLAVGDGTGRVDEVVGSVVDDSTGGVDEVVGLVVDDGTARAGKGAESTDENTGFVVGDRYVGADITACSVEGGGC